jgi:uncharacterized protein YcbK (DUF882 family)
MTLPGLNFQRNEFACRCGCGADTVDAELLAVLQDLRTHFMRPVIITSGHRCFSHNHMIGGAGGSMHLTGKAADIIVMFAEPSAVYRYLDFEYPDCYGIGNYTRWTHIDVRDKKRRW